MNAEEVQMTEDLKKPVVLFILVIIALVPWVGFTQSLRFGSVAGLVRIHGGNETVRVQLQHLGMTVQEQFSNDGRFTFWNVPYDAYTLLIGGPGHQPVSQEITIPGESYVTIEMGARTRLPDSALTSVFELQIPPPARRQYERAQDRLREGDCS